MSTVTTNLAPKGLEGIVATNSAICYIDGDHGVLAYRGINITNSLIIPLSKRPATCSGLAVSPMPASWPIFASN